MASIARPGGNLTGINFLAAELAAKRLDLLRELVPTATRVTVLIDSTAPTTAEAMARDVEPAARALGLQIRVVNVGTSSEITIPAIYPVRDYADVGGLMSYGASLVDALRQIGVYTGRILKGAKPAELPVVQSTKFELVINAETARMLGLAVPHSLLARADEVIRITLLFAAISRLTHRSNSAGRDVAEYNLERKRTSSTSSAGLPKRRAVDTYPCDALWLGPSWPCMSLDRYTQSTLNVARHAKKGEIESQIEFQEVQEGQASSAAQAAEGCCQHSGAGGCCNGSSRLRRQARSRRSGVKRRRGATSF